MPRWTFPKTISADKRTFVFKNFWHSGRQLPGGHPDIKQIFPGTILIFFRRSNTQARSNARKAFAVCRDAAHIGYRYCSTFVWPRRTYGKAKQISCNAHAQTNWFLADGQAA
ncbi:hypothetical protein CNR22_23860 [Sphingobacteriaceae bacterium]|nr:hypothetical protein CNR22_23860 [Sphingobacteriaceae bacterium]